MVLNKLRSSIKTHSLFILIILIIGFIFLSGCVTQHNTNLSTENNSGLLNHSIYQESGELKHIDYRGKEKWVFQANTSIHLSQDVVNGLLFFGSNTSVLAINATTGKEKWKYHVNDTLFFTPSVKNDTLCIGNTDGDIYIIDSKTGTKKLVISTNSSIYYLFLSNNIVYYLDGGKNVFNAHDVKTGEKLWMFQNNVSKCSAPLITKGIIYLYSNDRRIHAVDAQTGKEMWSFTVSCIISSDIGVYNDTLYFEGKNDFFAIDAKTGKNLWKYPFDFIGPGATTPIFYNTTVFFSGLDGRIYALNALTGEKKFENKIGWGIFSPPAIFNGVLYCGNGQNALYFLDAETGNEIGIFTTNWPVYSKPTIYDDRVYFDSNIGYSYDAGYVYALDLINSIQFQ